MKKYRMLLFLGALLLLMGCSEAEETVLQTEDSELAEAYELEKADSLDYAAIVKIDEKNQAITYKNVASGRNYTLSYNGATSMKNRFDEEIVVGQLREGDMVQVTFLKNKKLARKVLLDKTCNIMEEIDDFSINRAASTMMIAGQQYELSKSLAVLSEKEEVGLMDINDADMLRAHVVDHTVHSLVIDKGHGYIRLVNDEYFIGGFIEVGQDIIKPVTEGMLLAVPEGTYKVLITNKGYGGEKEVTVERNKETRIDVGDLKGEIVKMGKILFLITPDDAKLSIDGKEVDYSKPVELEYGIHQIVLKADGYATLTKYIKVGQELANIEITMEAGESTNSSEEEGASEGQNTGNSSVSSNSPVSPSLSKYSVYIDAPKGAELYLDGSYVGVVPASFTKESGNHTITLRKDGYQTRSYSIQIDDEEKDVTYSFSDLIVSSK
ncbi:MAG: PEGA domain-containing protein [Lachnospiraceae bacterium]|nr:PEGA domain-containing protein [Lachnospiraceae bacterium]